MTTAPQTIILQILENETIVNPELIPIVINDQVVSNGELITIITDYTQNSGGGSGGSVVSVAGKTGVVVLNKFDIGLGNVDNVADLNKPIGTLTQLALDQKADINHTHVKADITDFNDQDYATSAQGLLADTALQPPNIIDFETTSQLNDRDTANRERTNHTGTQLANTISDFDTAVSNNTDVVANTAKRTYPLAEENKLAGIEDGAEVNTVDSINGQTGVVVLNKFDVGLGSVPNIDTTNANNISAGTLSQARLPIGQFPILIEKPEIKFYMLLYNTMFSIRIVDLIAITTTGTATFSLKINGINITGLSGITSSPPTVSQATGNNILQQGEHLILEVTNISDAENLSINIRFNYE